MPHRNPGSSSTPPLAARWFWPGAVTLPACLAAVQVLSIRYETQTWDEAMELAAGYAHLKTGDYRLVPEHPPLGKALVALPLLILNPDLPLHDYAWSQADPLRFSDLFMWLNRVGPDRMLFTARCVSILVTLSLGFALALWTRRHFGAGAALVALALFSFDPNIIAYGRYIKNDVLATLLTFLAIVAWGAYLSRPCWPLLAGSALLLGLAIGAKFSAVFLLPVFALLFGIRWWQARRAPSNPLVAASVVAALALLVVLLPYAPETARCLARASSPGAGTRLVRPSVHRTTAPGKALAWAGAKLGCPDHALLVGFSHVVEHNLEGHESYLLGRHSKTGWWYYFPVAFAVKTPVGTLAAMALALGLALGRVARKGPRGLSARLRAAPIEYYLLAVPVVVFVGLSIYSKVNIGLRHLLPAYPFLFAATAIAVAARPWRWRGPVTAVLLLALAAESLAIYPHYLAFFNRLAGGPEAGPQYLVDSNIDWGQDVKKLKAWMIANKVPRICLGFFGTTPPSMYGIDFRNMMLMRDPERETRGCVVAVSVTLLQGVYVPRDRFAWLRNRQPVARVGYSIYVYDR